MFQKVVELVRENDELREEVDITSNTFWMFFPFHFPGLNLSVSYFAKVERRRVEVEGLLRERSEGWRAR